MSLKAGILYINLTSGWKKVPFSPEKGWKTYLFMRKRLEFETFKLLATLIRNKKLRRNFYSFNRQMG